MFDLFRFLVLRRPVPSDSAPAVVLDADSRLHSQLRANRLGDRPRESMSDAAAAFTRSDGFVTDPATLRLGAAVAAFSATLDDDPQAQLERLDALVRQVFDQEPDSLVASADFAADFERVTDTLIASRLAPDSATRAAADVVDVARTFDLLKRIAAADPNLDRPGALNKARSAFLVLPADVLPPEPLPFEVAPTPGPGTDTEGEQRALAQRATQLRTAIEMLRRAEPELVPVPQQRGERLHPEEIETRFTTFVRRDLNAPRAEEIAAVAPALAASVFESLPTEARGVLELRLGEGRQLSTTQSLTDLRTALTQTVQDLDTGAPTFHLPEFHLEPVSEPGIPDEARDPAPVAMTALPVTHGTITPAGVADLLVTRHHTLRYEAGDVAHVENIARGETVSRETRRLDASETIAVQETEVTSSDERDLQTTERFDLRQEAERVVHSDNGRVPGQPSSESYGSLVETSRGQQDSRREAETHGRDVTSRAASRVTSRTRSTLTTRVLRELEETATHTFADSGADDSVVYQWLERIVQAQVFSYGKRLMYDVVVPEPAAFLARALATRPYEAALPPKPAPFTMEPIFLNEWNWSYYVAGYGATGVSAPPPPEVVVARTFAGQAQNMFSGSAELRSTTLAAGTTIEIPDGYQASSAVVNLSWGGWEGASQDLYLAIGTRRLAFNWDSVRTQRTDLDAETGQLAVTARLDGGIYSYTIAIEITCTLTAERTARWQSGSHAAILSAARDRIADYEARLGQLRAGLRLLSAGHPPERKRELERDELHKACLAVISNQQFDGLSAVEHSPQGYPQPYLPNVELYGRYLRFLENAFEWDQMTWRYSPYFWGRKPYWVQAVLRDDPDPAFTDFLTAGAARVLLPVRPGFEAVLAEFMQSGAVPASSDLTDVVSPLYLPLLQELREPDAALDSGKPYTAPWEVRLPTTLVALRKDGTLPRWQQQTGPDGATSWVTMAGDPLP